METRVAMKDTHADGNQKPSGVRGDPVVPGMSSDGTHCDELSSALTRVTQERDEARAERTNAVQFLGGRVKEEYDRAERAEASISHLTQEREAASASILASFQEFEKVYFGTDGNTFDKAQAERIQQVLMRCYNAGRQSAESEISHLTQALEKLKPYVQHHDTCSMQQMQIQEAAIGHIMTGFGTTCTCGLAALVPPPAENT
jgi:hypothetical protein